MADIFAPRFSPYSYLATRPALRRSLGFVKVGSSYVRKPVARRRRVVRGYPRGTQGELKAVDVTSTMVQDSTGAVALINGIARGDDISDRVGRKVVMKSIQLNIVSESTPATGVDQFQRLLLVYDKQTNATALTGAQVLTTFNTTSFTNLENRNRFTVLYDKRFHLNATGESGAQITFSVNKRVNLPVIFNSGDAGTVADITTGSLYLLSIGSIAAGVTAGDSVIRSRVRYVDQ